MIEAGTTRIFHNLNELEAGINTISRQAMEKTLDKMLKKLKEFIEEDIYNAYSPRWYNDRRSYYLIENFNNIFETYFWNNFGKGVKGAIKINKTAFNSSPLDFIHGSGNPNTGEIYNQLNFNSYLEIMNNPDVIPSGKFNFPTNADMHKGQFWDDFLNWADDNFSEIFIEEFRNLS